MMKRTYVVGWPLWKTAAKLGWRLRFRVTVIRDDEAGVYVASSPDLRGLVAEAATLDELFANIKAGALDLLEDHLHEPPRRAPVPYMVMNGRPSAA